MTDTITKTMEDVSLDDITTRHRREKRELQAKIQVLKKNASKSKRKEAMEEVMRLEAELEGRHAAELKQSLKPAPTNNVSIENDITVQVTNCENGNDDTSNEQIVRVTKAQKRRDKKARENKEREDAQRVNLEDSRFSNKTVEAGLFESQLNNLKLALHEVRGDGDCLYNAVRHQVLQRGLGDYTVNQLREETAKYIRANKETLHFYMTNPDTGELLTDGEFEEYCQAVSSTPAWGGEVELKALSNVLRVPIEVLQAKGPSTIHGADEFPGPNLLITYHRYLLSLGEHYNSTRPLEDSELLNDN